MMPRLRSCLRGLGRTSTVDLEAGKIEDYRAGYPRFTALISAHKPWLICRRFDMLRARILLQKQDRLSVLEQQLKSIDQSEQSALFLGRSRSDKNSDRITTLSEIEVALTNYDQFIIRNSQALGLQAAKPRDVTSLQNWIGGSGCLARDETAYLSHRSELVSLDPVADHAILQLETWVEDNLIRYWRGFRSNRFHDVSTDPNVYIYRGPMVPRIAKTLLFLLIMLFLMMPVVMCNLVSAIPARLTIVMLSTVSYLMVLSMLTKSRTMELIFAGATYATILVVFVSSAATMQS